MTIPTRVRQTVTVGLLVIVIVAVLPFIAHTVPQAVGADYSFIVQSGSMEPALSVGDAIWVAEVPPADIHEGDIITFMSASAGPTTTHRVHQKAGSGDTARYVTKGDANPGPDAETVEYDDVVGKVVLVVPWVGYAIQFAGTDVGLVLLTIGPAGLLILNELWGLYKMYAETDTETETQ